MECLDDNAVSEFVSGALPSGLLTKVEGHLAKCRDCRTLVSAQRTSAAADQGSAILSCVLSILPLQPDTIQSSCGLMNASPWPTSRSSGPPHPDIHAAERRQPLARLGRVA